ncbi:hypothetical protein Vau01_045910 [Virgisporangium aurantiacum]|uniref:DUF3558 domain-containing protein n=1 Tax=Virgisporangium aurantiacum TaxID=175570 RepID=A0A8J3Z849_9ACTN|nr:hypothetical protein Vau01_045910 [Virgisporangium aurantiacum]
MCGLVLAGLLLGAAGCGALPRSGDDATPGAASSPSQLVGPAGRFSPPADQCAGVTPATAQKFKLQQPSKNSLPGMDSDPATGTLVDYTVLRCSWSVDNPAKGPNGRPNMFTLSVTYSVIDPAFPKSVQVATGIYELKKEKLRTDPERQVKRSDAPAGLGDEAAYFFAVETSSLGEGGSVDLIIRSSNAYVSISFSGADLRSDPSKPRGLQLVTSAVAEDQLQPTVLGIAGEVLSLLG